MGNVNCETFGNGKDGEFMQTDVVTTFSNSDFGSVRTVMINGEPWFVGKDVAEILGYSNNRKAIGDHVDEEDKGVTKCYTLGGEQDFVIINESGLYSLILCSKLPSAKRFKRWVTSEVLPSIRKTGGYGVNIQNVLEQMKEVVLDEMNSELSSIRKDIDRMVTKGIGKQDEIFSHTVDKMLQLCDSSVTDEDRWLTTVNTLCDIIAHEARVTHDMVLSSAYKWIERTFGIQLSWYKKEFSGLMGRDVSTLETVRWLETSKRMDMKGCLKHILIMMVG